MCCLVPGPLTCPEVVTVSYIRPAEVPTLSSVEGDAQVEQTEHRCRVLNKTGTNSSSISRTTKYRRTRISDSSWLLHISLQFSISNTVTVQEAAAMKQSFGVLDPVTGCMMDPDNAAIHRAIEPDQLDPLPGRGPPELPGRGFLAGPPEGGEGFPGGEGPPGGGFPNAGPGGGGNPRQGSDKLVENPPEVFTGIQAKAEHFLTQWKLYVGVNISNRPLQTTTRGACFSSLPSKEQGCWNGCLP